MTSYVRDAAIVGFSIFPAQLFVVFIEFESLTTVQNVINIVKQLLQRTSYRNAY